MPSSRNVPAQAWVALSRQERFNWFVALNSWAFILIGLTAYFAVREVTSRRQEVNLEEALKTPLLPGGDPWRRHAGMDGMLILSFLRVIIPVVPSRWLPRWPSSR
jgi:hypothetical protein